MGVLVPKPGKGKEAVGGGVESAGEYRGNGTAWGNTLQGGGTYSAILWDQGGRAVANSGICMEATGKNSGIWSNTPDLRTVYWGTEDAWVQSDPEVVG